MATPQSIRHLNEIRALNVLFRQGGMSRADLARALGLNRSTTGNIIANLTAERLVMERPDVAPFGAQTTRTGRPGIRIELAAAGANFIGAEIGVDSLTVLAIDLAAREVCRRSIAFPTARHPPEVGIAKIIEMITEVIASLPDQGLIRGLCVALPALLGDGGTVINAQVLGWRDVTLKTTIEAQLGLSGIVIENDANAFAIAETYRDASHASETVAFLLIENGAGGGIVSGGRLFRGSNGMAAEFGQLVIGGNGYYRGRHKAGHLESYIGKDAVIARYHANGAPADAGLDDLLAALENNDAVALQTASDWGRQLAAGLVQLTSVLNPEAIILGGSVAPIFRWTAGTVLAAMQQEFLDGFAMPRVAVSVLGQKGPALGSALLMHQRMFSVNENIIYPGAEPIASARSTAGGITVTAPPL